MYELFLRHNDHGRQIHKLELESGTFHQIHKIWKKKKENNVLL